jgi:hypothetical protein|tara:strand:- start:128 stop:253 length:126 start_codon:yes stop_codon:yes gene_type:complete
VVDKLTKKEKEPGGLVQMDKTADLYRKLNKKKGKYNDRRTT